MKALRHLPVLILTALIVSNCSNPQDNKISFNELSKEDSLAVVSDLFDSLRNEIYSHPMYEIPNDPMPPIFCGVRMNLKISINKSFALMIGNEINGNITETVYHYYTANQEENDLESNFPWYSRTSLEDIEKHIEKAINAAEEVEKTPDADPVLIDFMWAEVEVWEKKKSALITLGVKELSEISPQAQIRLEYPETFKEKNTVIDSVLLAFIQMRDNSSMTHFKKSYVELYYNYSQTKNEDLKEQLDALKMLHPIKLFDVPYCRENDIWCGDIPEPVQEDVER